MLYFWLQLKDVLMKDTDKYVPVYEKLQLAVYCLEAIM